MRVESFTIRSIPLLVAGLLITCLSPAGLRGEQTKPLDAVEGKLSLGADGSPVLRTPTGLKELSSDNSYLLHTLKDKRLQGRELRLEGTPKPHGEFEVERIFTMHDGKLFRVRYYCRVCNIEALEPGPCVCCQKPTELQEIPVEQASQY